MKKKYRLKILSTVSTLTLALALLLFSKAYSQNTHKNEEEGLALSVFGEIETNQRYVNIISSLEKWGDLPIGQVREINGQTYVIAIDHANATSKKGAFINAYFRFKIPGTTEELIFGAKNIAFNAGGIGLSSHTKLVLLNDKYISINKHVSLSLTGGGKNYIEWNCSGFQSVHLQGDFEFDPGWIQPEEPGRRFGPG